MKLIGFINYPDVDKIAALRFGWSLYIGNVKAYKMLEGIRGKDYEWVMVSNGNIYSLES